MTIAEEIKERISMQKLIKHYGFKVNRAGFANCPLHTGDDTPSLKVYKDLRGWHCFGCGQGGDIFDFVQLYYGVDFKKSMIIIDNDFNLGLCKKPTLTEYRRRQASLAKLQKKREKRAKLIKKANENYWKEFDEWKRLDDNLFRHCPKDPSCPVDDWNPLYIEALQKIELQRYRLDFADIEREVIESDPNR